MLSLPIPPFDRKNKLHRALAQAAKHAEEVAASVELAEGTYFITARRRIRAALSEDGVAEKTDRMVKQLLSDNSASQP